jgi:hypothetical protein
MMMRKRLRSKLDFEELGRTQQKIVNRGIQGDSAGTLRRQEKTETPSSHPE